MREGEKIPNVCRFMMKAKDDGLGRKKGREGGREGGRVPYVECFGRVQR